MFRVPTVLVVGAGASAELGLPQGSGLLAQLAKALDIRFQFDRQESGDYRIQHALRQYCLGQTDDQHDGIMLLNEHLHAGLRIREAAQEGMSIDAIIDQHENPMIEFVGKVAIVRKILEAEKRCPLSNKAGVAIDKCDGTWLPRLGRLLVEGRRIGTIGEIFENLIIVTFNYDRCIEQYLPHSLRGHYGIPITDAQALVAGLRIYHPFGKVGRLPWGPGTECAVEFGNDERADLVASAAQIQTFTEQMADRKALAEIRAAIQTAHRIVFLGFAYHRPNLEILTPPNSSDARSIFGTVKGISSQDRSVVQRQLGTALDVEPSNVNLLDLTCTELFDQNWRGLTE